MIKLEDMDTKEKLIMDFFIWLFDDSRITANSIELERELDMSLAPFYTDPYIYYPKQISDFFNTTAMQRLGRISQLSLASDIYSNLYHTRLEHSKGAYNRKLEEMIYNFQNQKWKKNIEDNQQKIYLLADLFKIAGHDIGHFPLSHLMEIELLSNRGAHEFVGKRILLEDSEISSILLSISPDLPDALKKILEEPIMNFNEHDDSNYDVDRFDYLTRDYFYFGTPLYLPYAHYETISVDLDKNGLPKTLSDFCIQESATSTSSIDVYDYSSLENIETFLKLRLQAYEKIYSNPVVHTHEKTVSAFFNAFAHTSSDCGNELRCFINAFKGHSIDSIDLKEFLRWDDIRLYSQILDIAKTHPDSNIRSLAMMTIPNIEAFLYMIYSHLGINKSENKQYSSEDIAFLRKIKHIIKSEDEISLALKNPSYTDKNTIFFPPDLDTSNLPSFIFSNSQVKFAYNPNEPIYVRDADGKIYELSHHPHRSYDWNKFSTELKSNCTYIPYLKFNGLTDAEINYLKGLADKSTKYNNSKDCDYSSKINMQPLQIGKCIEDYFLGIDTDTER